jgi:signal transduction histidine kinase
MAKELSGTVELETLVTAVERRTADVLPARTVATFYWNTDSEAYEVLSQHGLGEELAAAAEQLTFPLGAVFDGRLAAGETLVVERPQDWGAREQAAMARFNIGSLAGVPLVIRGQVRGAFVAGCAIGRRPFSPNQVRFLEAIAHQLAVAIETAALYRAQQAETQHSAALARVGQELISSLATPQVYGDLCRVTTAVLRCDVSSTFLWSGREGVYLAAASYGETPEGWEALRVVRLTPAMAGALFAACGPTGLARLDRLPVDDPVRRAIVGAHGLTAALIVPLWRGDDIVGFHCAGLRGPTATFTRLQERIARGIAQLASLALESARLVGELERVGRIKSDFVATMSHELRTPLNVIIGYHDLLLEGEFGALTAAQTERLRRADQSARELLDLINATLDLSRLEARQVDLQVDDVDLVAMIDEVDAEISGVRHKSGVEFAWRLPARMPAVRTDPVKLKVVLKNLIHNAIKFTDAGTVTVAVAATPGRLEFEITDTGIGIPPELRAVIFEPFRQADSSSTRSYGGVGLGLYIVQRLLDLLGGGITVESEVGRGSCFRVWLPAT